LASHDLQNPLHIEEIRNVIPDFFYDNRNFVWLNGWDTLRPLLIERNPEVANVIEQLENAQQKIFNTLINSEAIMFDSTRLAIEVFNPKNKRDILAKLDDARDRFPENIRFDFQDTNATLRALKQTLSQTLVSTEYGQPARHLDDPVHRELAHILIGGRREDYGIRQDFNNAPEGWERSDQGIPLELSQYMAKLTDPETDRELLLIFGHQTGGGSHDLAAADLIYDNSTHQSIMFVQYKRFNRSDFINPSDIDTAQMNVLLNLCRECECRSMHDGAYLAHPAIRLGDCPAFYKLITHDLAIEPTGRRMVGQYIQACLLSQSLQEETATRKSILQRALPHETFYKLLGRAQVGSRAVVYDDLRQKMLEFAHSKYVYAAESVLHGS